MSEVPTLREELDRKAIESVEWLINEQAHGRITDEQYAVGINALFLAVSGLTDDDIFHIISEASRLAPSVRSEIKRHFLRIDVVVTLKWRADDEFFIVSSRRGYKVTSEKVMKYDTPAMALTEMKKAASLIIAKGYVEL